MVILLLIGLLSTSSSFIALPSRAHSPPSTLAKLTRAATGPRTYPYEAVERLKIAAVEPVFTSTAYSSFYGFYRKYDRAPPDGTVTTDLQLLNVSLVDNWGWSDGLRRFLVSPAASDHYNLTWGKNLVFISDVNVTQGVLFASDGTRTFDLLILGFTEYVTAQQYAAYRSFVERGGVLIFMSATNFLAEVAYYPATQHLALVRGHGWSFNGLGARRDVFDRWMSENTNWIGSTYWDQVGARYVGSIPVDNNPIGQALRAQFGSRVFTSYGGHEENYLTNLTQTSIIAHWMHPLKGRDRIVAAYLHHHKKSYLMHMGVMGVDVIASDASVQVFLAQSVLFAANTRIMTPAVSYYRNPSNVSFYSNGSQGPIAFNGNRFSSGKTGQYIYASYMASVDIPFGYRFENWSSTGGVALVDPALNTTEVIVTGPGSLTANFSSLLPPWAAGAFELRSMVLALIALAGVLCDLRLRHRQARFHEAAICWRRIQQHRGAFPFSGKGYLPADLAGAGFSWTSSRA